MQSILHSKCIHSLMVIWMSSGPKLFRLARFHCSFIGAIANCPSSLPDSLWTWVEERWCQIDTAQSAMHHRGVSYQFGIIISLSSISSTRTRSYAKLSEVIDTDLQRKSWLHCAAVQEFQFEPLLEIAGSVLASYSDWVVVDYQILKSSGLSTVCLCIW